MKFLTEARLPFLDDYISESIQSTIIEIFFWTVVYLIFASGMSRVLRAIFRELSIWKTARSRGGVFCGNGRDDAVLLVVLSIHHSCAAALMYTGLVQGNIDMWRHGYLLETGFEVADLIAIAFSFYPYKWDGMKPDIKVAMVFHHMPGIALCGFVMENGLNANPHMQALGLWLLGATAANCLVGIFLYSLDFEKQMWLAALGYNFAIGFFLYCRFYIFPIESFALIRDVRNSDLKDTIVLKILYFCGIALAIFNLAIVMEGIPKCIRYFRRAMDGVTPIELEPVPPSRDSMLRKQRRGCLQVVMDTLNVSSRRRTSFATVMMLNTVEDIAKSSQDDGLDDIAGEDMKALNETLSAISDKKTK